MFLPPPNGAAINEIPEFYTDDLSVLSDFPTIGTLEDCLSVKPVFHAFHS
jgi:hypothetical protein